MQSVFAAFVRHSSHAGRECCSPVKVSGSSCRTVPPSAACRPILPPDCTPAPIAYNPCVPAHHHGKDTHKKYKNIFLFISIPVILIQAYRAFSGHHDHDKYGCREYPYMMIRTKRFPWGDGNKSFFHNPKVNYLPEECGPPPIICD